MGDSPDWVLLGRYLRGDCAPAEVDVVERWVAADAANAELLAFLREIWDAPAVTRPPIDKAEAWRTLQASLAAAEKPVVRPLQVLPTSTSARPRWSAWRRGTLLGGAAAAAIAAIGAVTWRQLAIESPTGPGREYATTAGQRAELILVDGTRVWLSVDSRIRLLPGYGTKARDVELEGEAYFVVDHDAHRPFRVHTRGAVSEDLGTEFNVRAYRDADLVVAVTSGRVAMRSREAAMSGGPATELVEGQVGRLHPNGRITVATDVDLSTLLGWREGVLRFEGDPLVEVVRELERWYDLEIVVDDSALARVPVTTSLAGHSADEALALLAEALDVGYRRTDRTVHLGATASRRSAAESR
jgi:transmembrane sensor